MISTYKAKKALILLATITIVATGTFAYLIFMQWDGPKVAEAQTFIETVATCQNTNTRSDNGCGSGCADWDTTGSTNLWYAYYVDLYQNNINGSRYDQFVALDDVCSDGDHYYADYPADGISYPGSNPTELIAGKCDCNLGGPYAVCCNGSTAVNATPLPWNPNNPLTDPYQPPVAVCPSGATKEITSTLSCSVSVAPPSDQAPIGHQDSVNSATCSTIGWAYDPDAATTAIFVNVYEDGVAGSGTSLGQYTANVSRPDIVGASGGVPASAGPNHGFSITLPSSLGDSKTHSLYVYGIDTAGGSNTLLTGSPMSITCPAPQQLPPQQCYPAVDIKVN